MFVREGARKSLVSSERDKFLNEEWPAMLSRIEQLGMKVEDLLKTALTEENDS
jgi:GntR family transcriptional regulator